MKKIYELKKILKEKASYIKNSRNEARKLKQNKQGLEAHKIHIGLVYYSTEYRNHHIAYCELRGKTRDQIEKPRVDNPPNERIIKRIKEMYSEVIVDEKAICVG
jgi:hypothetical protein